MNATRREFPVLPLHSRYAIEIFSPVMIGFQPGFPDFVIEIRKWKPLI